jgi:hypothetical protein
MSLGAGHQGTSARTRLLHEAELLILARGLSLQRSDECAISDQPAQILATSTTDQAPLPLSEC